MKKLLLLMLACYASSSFASETLLQEEKFYIESKSVLIGNNGIFADVNGEVIQVESVFHDVNGIYIEPKENWYCSTCNKHRVRYPCYVCGKKGPDNPWGN